MSTNPITSFIKSGMQFYREREAEMVDRVSEASITAQKIVDERHGPHKSDLWWQTERRSRPFNHFFVASSGFKGKDEGCVSSFKAAKYYSQEAAKRRDQLLSDIDTEI